jgi:hypothetical protein
LQFVHDAAQVLAQFQDQGGPLLALLRPVSRRLWVRQRQGQLQGKQGQLLADFIVNPAGQPFVLVLMKQLLTRQKRPSLNK